VLVPPDDPVALDRALVRLIGDPQLRRRLGRAGVAAVTRRFSHAPGLIRLAERFGIVPAVQADQSAA
jgi:hypothetical protein